MSPETLADMRRRLEEKRGISHRETLAVIGALQAALGDPRYCDACFASLMAGRPECATCGVAVP